MKITITKKRIIISLIIFILLLLMISINYKAYIINNNFNYLLFVLSIIICITSCVLFATKIQFKNKTHIFITVISLIVSFLFSYIIIELLNQNNLFNLYTKRLLFNFIVIITLHLFIYALCNKINLTIILSNSLIFVLGISNYVVTCFRGTPLVPWDILSIKTAAYVASTYTFEFNHYLLLALCLFTFIISIGLKASYKFKKQKINYIIRFSCLAIIAIITVSFYETNIIDYFDFENNLWRPQDEYSNNGFLASFVKQSKNLFNDKPNNYSVSTVEDILAKVEENLNGTKVNTATNDSPNIIVIMNESYCDLTVNR